MPPRFIIGFFDRAPQVISLPRFREEIFTIPKVLRGLFQRERRLLSILTRSAYDAVRMT